MAEWLLLAVAVVGVILLVGTLNELYKLVRLIWLDVRYLANAKRREKGDAEA
jgi:hypothetical protein